MNDQMMENNQNHSCLCEVINCLVSSCKIGATGPTGLQDRRDLKVETETMDAQDARDRRDLQVPQALLVFKALQDLPGHKA